LADVVMGDAQRQAEPLGTLALNPFEEVHRCPQGSGDVCSLIACVSVPQGLERVPVGRVEWRWFPRLRHGWVDQGYRGQFLAWAGRRLG
jgi:hypothetical protein